MRPLTQAAIVWYIEPSWFLRQMSAEHQRLVIAVASGDVTLRRSVAWGEIKSLSETARAHRYDFLFVPVAVSSVPGALAVPASTCHKNSKGRANHKMSGMMVLQANTQRDTGRSAQIGNISAAEVNRFEPVCPASIWLRPSLASSDRRLVRGAC